MTVSSLELRGFRRHSDPSTTVGIKPFPGSQHPQKRARGGQGNGTNKRLKYEPSPPEGQTLEGG